MKHGEVLTQSVTSAATGFCKTLWGLEIEKGKLVAAGQRGAGTGDSSSVSGLHGRLQVASGDSVIQFC